MPNTFGSELLPVDLANLEARWITRDLAVAAGLRRVDSETGRSMFGRRRGDFAGIIIPNMFPGEPHVREYRLRRDNPDLEYSIDGTVRESAKYVQPSGRRNLIYFPPVRAGLLTEAAVPVIITEGEFKTLALWRLATHDAAVARFLPIGLAGVWNFRGTVGKTTGPKGDRRDVKGLIDDVGRITWKGRKVTIAYDADSERNPKVRAARWQLTSALIERGAKVGVLEWPIEEGKGIDDRLAEVGPDRVLADIAAIDFGDWHAKLLRNDQGKLLACHDNAALFLEYSEEWNGVLGYNEFTGGHVILKPPPAPVTADVGSEIEDTFDTEVTRWLERRGILAKPDISRRVIDLVAKGHQFHPVRDYLESLIWDGVPRVGTWLIDCCGVESSDEDPNHFAMAVGKAFLISAVARIFQPGCKVDHILVLEGLQGIGKSTVPRILASDEYFTDQLKDMTSKDASMQLRGMWFIELPELEVLSRTELARAKAFITQQTERFRLPYGRRVVLIPRQCVFIGTTNADTWQKDETGGRRFWPVRCRSIDIDALRRDRDRLWAEAVQSYRSGSVWWLDKPELIADAFQAQQERYDADAWQDGISAWLNEGSRAEVSIDQILTMHLEKPRGQWTQADKNRIARCLRALGWERFCSGPRGAREWKYRRVHQSRDRAPVDAPVSAPV